jgi:predicted amidohydrolase YtcJ
MAVSSTEADLVLAGGKIRTPAHPSGFVQALAVRDGVVAAVGSDEDVRELTGRRTRVIDLGGRLALPAFGDAHVHPVSGGLESLRCDLVGLRSRHECLDAVASQVFFRAAGRLGARRRLDHVGVPRGAAHGGGPGHGDRRAARLPAEP